MPSARAPRATVTPEPQHRAIFRRWSSEPQRPVARAVRDVVRSADQPNTRDQCPVATHAPQDVVLARDLGFTVGSMGLHDVALQRREQRAVLVPAGRAVIGVDPARGDQHVQAGLTSQGFKARLTCPG